MSAISWKGVTGDWSTAGDWSGGKVPTVSDDVTIGAAGSYTVTISKASSAKSLNLNDANATIVDVSSLQVAGTINVLAGAFDLGTSGSVSAASLNVSAGAVLKKSAGTDVSKIVAKLVNTGTVLATSGTLQFSGGGQFAAAGSIAGNGGTIDFNAGTFTLSGATAKFDGGVLIDGVADINLGAGKTLTMAGANTLNTANGFDGSGTVVTTGTVTAKAGNVAGTAIWRDTGAVIQTGNFGIENTATIATTATTGIWSITNDSDIPFSNNGTFLNAGRLEKTAGTGVSTISAFLSNTGTVVATSGTLQFTGGGQFGTTGSIAGTGGTIELNTGTFSLASATAKISGGLLLDGFARVNLNNGQTLTLAGTDVVNAANGGIFGSGTLLTTGTVTVQGAAIGGHATWLDSATVVQTGNFTIQNTATIATAATGKWNITTDASIPFSNNGMFANAGLLEKTAGVGTSMISAYLSNTGSVLATSGTLQFTGGGRFGAKNSVVGNGGTVDLNSGTFTLASATATIGGGVLVDGFAQINIGAGQTLTMAGADKVNSSNAAILGRGTLLTTGTVTVGAGGIGGTATWQDSGTVIQTGSFSISGGATIATTATTGTWNIVADAGLPFSNGGIFNNGGVLEKTAGTGVSTITAFLTNAGTVLATSGTLQFTGGGQFAANASIIGKGGTVDLNSGNFSLGSATAAIGGGVLLDGFAVINIGAGQTLTMGGADTVNAGSGGITGAGTLLTTGTVMVQAGTIGGHATWLDNATVLQSGSFSIANTATIATSAGGIWNITTDTGMPFSGNGTFVNGGLLEKTAGVGTSTISAYLWNTGTVLAKSGTLSLTGGGEFDSTGGIVGNGGTVELNSGVFTLASETATIGGGVLLDAFGQINIGTGQTLTMAGKDTIDAANGGIIGGGTLLTTGTVTAHAGSISGIATWRDSGMVVQTGDFSILGGATIATTATGKWNITTDAGLPFSNGGLFVNAGLLEKTAGTGSSTISAPVVNNGTVMVSSGTIDLASGVDPTSSGIFQLNANGTLEIAALIGSASKIQFLGAAPTNRLIVDSVANFGTHVGTASYTGPLLQSFVAGDVIDLKGVASAGIALTYSAGTGILQIAENGTAAGSLRFENATLGAGAFHAAADGAGGSLITHS